jgi:hypothetical protein
MSDVFISYARSTATQAQQVADTLSSLGYAVWRDNYLPAHRAYAEVIQERASSAPLRAPARGREACAPLGSMQRPPLLRGSPAPP